MFLVAGLLGALVLKAERPRLFLEADHLPRLRDAWTARARASAELFRYCANRLEDAPGEWSGSGWPLEPARSLALVALLEGTCALDKSPGGRMAAKAISLALSLSSAEPGNPAEMLAMAIVYDWLYRLIELDDRARLRRALGGHIEFHLAREGPSFAARASLLACADELPRGDELLARSARGAVERALFGGLHPAEASPLAAALAAPSFLARMEHPHPTAAERALILFAASEGSEEARWAAPLLGAPEEPWMRAFEFLWPCGGGGFPPPPYSCASSPLPPRAVARESWEEDAFVASAGVEGGGIYRGRTGVEFFRGRAATARAERAGVFSYLRADCSRGTFEAAIVRGEGALARLVTLRAEDQLLLRARGKLPPRLLRPQGSLARNARGLKVSSPRRTQEFIIGFPGGKKAFLRREEGLCRIGGAAVAFADGRRSLALDVASGVKGLLVCGLEEGEYDLRLGMETRALAASPAGLLFLELQGEPIAIRIRRKGR